MDSRARSRKCFSELSIQTNVELPELELLRTTNLIKSILSPKSKRILLAVAVILESIGKKGRSPLSAETIRFAIEQLEELCLFDCVE